MGEKKTYLEGNDNHTLATAAVTGKLEGAPEPHP